MAEYEHLRLVKIPQQLERRKNRDMVQLQNVTLRKEQYMEHL